MADESARIIGAVDRLTAAVEKLAEPVDPDMKLSPPECPNCGVFDPLVKISGDDGGRGRMSHVFITAVCELCEKEIYILPESYANFTNTQDLEQEVKLRDKMWKDENG